MSRLLSIALVVVLTATALAAEPIPGIGPDGEVKKVHGGFMFTEGPASDGKGNLYFSDVAGNTLYKLNAKNEQSILLSSSGHSNGLMVNAAGNIVACQMDGQL